MFAGLRSFWWPSQLCINHTAVTFIYSFIWLELSWKITEGWSSFTGTLGEEKKIKSRLQILTIRYKPRDDQQAMFTKCSCCVGNGLNPVETTTDELWYLQLSSEVHSERSQFLSLTRPTNTSSFFLFIKWVGTFFFSWCFLLVLEQHSCVSERTPALWPRGRR